MKTYPVPTIDEMALLEEILAERQSGKNRLFFSVHADALKLQWQAYIYQNGKPFDISPQAEPWHSKRNTFKNLYTAGGGCHAEVISNLRRATARDFCICPYCGRTIVEQLDHYLPQSGYAQFAVLPKNLVPSCSVCNRKKEDVVPGADGTYLPHPYFDQLNGPIYSYSFRGPKSSPKFDIKIEPFADAKFLRSIERMFNELELKERLVDIAINVWSTLVEEILRGDIYQNHMHFLEHIRTEIKRRESRYGSVNEAESRFYVCLLGNTPYLNFLKKLQNS